MVPHPMLISLALVFEEGTSQRRRAVNCSLYGIAFTAACFAITSCGGATRSADKADTNRQDAGGSEGVDGGDHVGEGGSQTGSGGSSAISATDAENPINHLCGYGDCDVVGTRQEPTSGPDCPTSAPSLGATCGVSSLECSYGDSQLSYCREYFVCTGGAWTQPSTVACQKQPQEFCPADPANGTACVVGDVAVHVPCEYPDGVQCYCFGNPIGVAGADGEWECYGPPRNGSCPTSLPNLGEGCTTNGQYCNYGVRLQGCSAPYADVYCYRGAWERGGGGCVF